MGTSIKEVVQAEHLCQRHSANTLQEFAGAKPSFIESHLSDSDRFLSGQCEAETQIANRNLFHGTSK
ncbi:hypothetical protein RB895 [Rhodopirellula baltica SH 1]|uniref:Uncharacterized protein n=1 Tax=Rhodopirellula baltica (strain DSM 10527 / NCIMB 13988 / SH1) TaxID=243090 RepID=Q7UY42_RHOBA|nr:hypothetical protein RB895 [Rhodopirellula baltica SH 1]